MVRVLQSFMARNCAYSFSISTAKIYIIKNYNTLYAREAKMSRDTSSLFALSRKRTSRINSQKLTGRRANDLALKYKKSPRCDHYSFEFSPHGARRSLITRTRVTQHIYIYIIHTPRRVLAKYRQGRGCRSRIKFPH